MRVADWIWSNWKPPVFRGGGATPDLLQIIKTHQPHSQHTGAHSGLYSLPLCSTVDHRKINCTIHWTYKVHCVPFRSRNQRKYEMTLNECKHMRRVLTDGTKNFGGDGQDFNCEQKTGYKVQTLREDGCSSHGTVQRNTVDLVILTVFMVLNCKSWCLGPYLAAQYRIRCWRAARGSVKVIGGVLVGNANLHNICLTSVTGVASQGADQTNMNTAHNRPPTIKACTDLGYGGGMVRFWKNKIHVL